MLAYMMDGIDRNRRRFELSSRTSAAREGMLSGSGNIHESGYTGGVRMEDFHTLYTLHKEQVRGGVV